MPLGITIDIAPEKGYTNGLSEERGLRKGRSLNVENIVVGMFEVNCWVVWSGERKALVIDPGDDAPVILRALEKNDLQVSAYVLTHGHMDHVSAVAELHARRPAPIALHAADAQWAFTESNQMPPYYPAPDMPGEVERTLSEGQVWEDGGLRYTVIETPGHTPGSVCLYFEEEGALFSGDTLFAGSIGRTDFTGGDPRAMTQSLRRLKDLPDSTVVYAGHGPQTTIAQEKKKNFFLRT